MKIGFFDSGIGGITVLNEALKILPQADYIYYADTDNVPYGIKSKEEVKKFIFKAVKFIIRKNIDALVVACNTATSIAIHDLRDKYNIPIIGMEPAVKPAIEKNGEKRVLVLATPLTLREDKYQNLVSKVDSDNIVDSLPISGLVEYAEQFQFNTQTVITFLQNKFDLYDMNLYGTVVLGCTHFIYFKKYIKQIIPANIDLIDGNQGTVRHLKNVLLEKNLINDKSASGKIEFYSSGKKKDNVLLKRYLQVLEPI